MPENSSFSVLIYSRLPRTRVDSNKKQLEMNLHKMCKREKDVSLVLYHNIRCNNYTPVVKDFRKKVLSKYFGKMYLNGDCFLSPKVIQLINQGHLGLKHSTSLADKYYTYVNLLQNILTQDTEKIFTSYVVSMYTQYNFTDTIVAVTPKQFVRIISINLGSGTDFYSKQQYEDQLEGLKKYLCTCNDDIPVLIIGTIQDNYSDIIKTMERFHFHRAFIDSAKQCLKYKMYHFCFLDCNALKILSIKNYTTSNNHFTNIRFDIDTLCEYRNQMKYKESDILHKMNTYTCGLNNLKVDTLSARCVYLRDPCSDNRWKFELGSTGETMGLYQLDLHGCQENWNQLYEWCANE